MIYINNKVLGLLYRGVRNGNILYKYVVNVESCMIQIFLKKYKNMYTFIFCFVKRRLNRIKLFEFNSCECM